VAVVANALDSELPANPDFHGGRDARLKALRDITQAGRLSHRLRTLVFPSLMIIDEIGYLPISRTGAMLFFQLMSRRYEHASTVLTSNKGFEEWARCWATT
jgi:DNA replication protein DnaC